MTRLRSFLIVGALAAPFLTIPGRGAWHGSATGSIAGTVTGAKGAPLAGATVIVTGVGLQAVSGAKGEYRISGVTTGKVEVVARRLGFRPQKRTVEVKESLVTQADFALIPGPLRVPSGRSPGPRPSGSPFAVPGMLNADQCSVSVVPLLVEFSMSWKITA